MNNYALGEALDFQMKVRAKELALEILWKQGKITTEEARKQRNEFINKL
jgi:hypothetical protein